MSLVKITLLMTRPHAASQAFVAALPEDVRGMCDVIVSPVLDIQPVEGAMTPAFDAAVFSSANGVAFAPPANNRPAYCVGPATTARALNAGWDATQVGVDAESLVAAMTPRASAGLWAERLVHFAGVHTRGDIAERLGQAGLSIQRVTVYDQRPRPLSQAALEALHGEQAVIVPLFSPRSALHFCDQVGDVGSVHIVAMSDAVAETCRASRGWDISVAQAANQPEMLRAVQRGLQKRIAEALSG